MPFVYYQYSPTQFDATCYHDTRIWVPCGGFSSRCCSKKLCCLLQEGTWDNLAVVASFHLFLIVFLVGSKRWGDACGFQGEDGVMHVPTLVATCITSCFRSY